MGARTWVPSASSTSAAGFAAAGADTGAGFAGDLLGRAQPLQRMEGAQRLELPLDSRLELGPFRHRLARHQPGNQVKPGQHVTETEGDHDQAHHRPAAESDPQGTRQGAARGSGGAH